MFRSGSSFRTFRTLSLSVLLGIGALSSALSPGAVAQSTPPPPTPPAPTPPAPTQPPTDPNQTPPTPTTPTTPPSTPPADPNQPAPPATPAPGAPAEPAGGGLATSVPVPPLTGETVVQTVQTVLGQAVIYAGEVKDALPRTVELLKADGFTVTDEAEAAATLTKEDERVTLTVRSVTGLTVVAIARDLGGDAQAQPAAPPPAAQPPAPATPPTEPPPPGGTPPTPTPPKTP